MAKATCDVLQTDELPALPRVGVKKIFDTLDALVLSGQCFVGQLLTGRTYRRFCEQVTTGFPRSVSVDVVESSLTELAGTSLRHDSLYRACWRLAANVDKLRVGRSVPTWTRQSEAEWMLMEVTEVVPKKSRRDLPGADIHLRILSGSAASRMVRTYWTRGFAGVLAQELGFSRPYRGYPFVDMLQLTLLKLFGFFEPELTTPEGPMFNKVKTSSTVQSLNRVFIRRRTLDHPDYNCPKQIPCHTCHMGYDRCPWGTHPRTYDWARCQECGRFAWHDPPVLKLGRCITCFGKLS